MAQFFRNMSPERALEKAKWYCSFQERCKNHVQNRLTAWKVEQKHFDAIIETLEKEDFLNEKRFTEAYVRGKFLIKKWGKIKITSELYQLSIDKRFINDAITTEIDEGDYLKTIKELIEKKIFLLKEIDETKKKEKLYRYLLSKGYESELIFKLLAL
ncbi:MAG: hypothetical protein CVT95_01650 [Bacteroidetes bacterium HGW-Bacteroidetes-12]|nr:MAG: hypothetical protein CVT95_01650 [Bacteroidetes bacterium HGW-Bacteroidetes-12]